jgi:hypothetical protein
MNVLTRLLEISLTRQSETNTSIELRICKWPLHACKVASLEGADVHLRRERGTLSPLYMSCQTPFPYYVALLHFPEQFLAFYLSSSPSIMATTPQDWTNIPEAEAEAKIDLRDKNVSWYDPKLKKLGPSARELLENYSKIPPAEVEDHVYKMVRFVLNLIGRS